jgi:HEAT repeat protein
MCYQLSVVPVLKRRFRVAAFWACMIFALAPYSVSAEPPPRGNSALDQAFQKLLKLELGQDLGIFTPIRQAVVASRTDEKARADLESRLVAVLRDDASDLGKDYACRQLVIVGTDASLSALAALLPNPSMSYMARYALEGIGSPAAKKTLREMLGTTEGRQKVGVVISLGRLTDTEAVPAIAALLASHDNELREACLIALGRIAGLPAAEAIQTFAGEAPESLHPVVVDAQLDAAASLCRQGEQKKAAEICESLMNADSERVQAAGFRGLIAARPSDSLALVIDGLKSGAPWKRAVAADWVVGLAKPEEIERIASAIGELPAAGEIAAFVSLKQRSNPAIHKAAWKAIEQQDSGVCTAALAALIGSGTPEDVPALVALLTGKEDESVRNAAFETLRLMPVAGVNEALITWMTQAKDLPAVVVECALARRSPDFVPVFLRAAGSSDGATRLEAFKALEIMATEKEAGALAALVCKTAPGEEREAANRAVWMSCQKITNPARRSAPLLTAMEKGDSSAQCALLPTLARIGGQDALPAVRKAMKSSDQAVRDAGYRALANWPDASVADELLELAQTSDVESYRIWLLRAYARVVALPSDRPPQKTFELLRDAMKMATRKEDKELFLSRLAAVRVPDALALLLAFVDDGELKEAALPAVFTLAKGLSQSHPDQAAAALKKIQPMTQDAALQQQIPKVLRDIDARKQNQPKK